MTISTLPPPPSPRPSQVSIRRPAVMLVRIEREEEQSGLDLESLGVVVYRVRHPLPACERMRVLRPEVVLLGESVLSPDMAHVLFAAHETVACVMPRTQLLDGARLRDWILDTIEVVRRRRREALAAQVGQLFQAAHHAAAG